MSKIIQKIILIFLSLSINLITLISFSNPVFSDHRTNERCSSAIGAGYETLVNDIPTQVIPEGLLIKVRFSGSAITNGYYYRLRFDSVSTTYARASGNTVTIEINNDYNLLATKRVKGTHISTLEYSSDGREGPHELCGAVEYRVGYSPQERSCKLTLNPYESRGDNSYTVNINQDIIVSANDILAVSYPLLLDGSQIGEISGRSDGTGETVVRFTELKNSAQLYLGNSRLGVNENFCHISVKIKGLGGTPQPGCSLISPNAPYGEFKIKTVNLNPNTDYFASLQKQGEAKNNLPVQNPEIGTSLEFSLGRDLSEGDYTAIIYESSNPNSPICPAITFAVGVGGIITQPSPAATQQCKKASDPSFRKGVDRPCTEGGGISCDADGISTAIGCIHTQPAALVKDVLKFLIGISGGIALLLMALGAFGMITSAGNPESLQAGKDRFTQAFIGLLFVIFSVLLLQLIGVDILGIPGFGR